MAELRDHLNRIVLHVDIEKQEAEEILSNVKLVFQQNIFIDNNIGWIDKVQAEVRWNELPINRTELLSFINAAETWAELSLSELAKTHFSNIWQLGNSSAETFSIEFTPLLNSPSKTDAFTVIVFIGFGSLWKEQQFSSDYTSLVNFIKDLSASID